MTTRWRPPELRGATRAPEALEDGSPYAAGVYSSRRVRIWLWQGLAWLVLGVIAGVTAAITGTWILGILSVIWVIVGLTFLTWWHRNRAVTQA